MGIDVRGMLFLAVSSFTSRFLGHCDVNGLCYPVKQWAEQPGHTHSPHKPLETMRQSLQLLLQDVTVSQ